MKKRSLGITLSYLNTILGMLFGILVSSIVLRFLGDVEYGLYQTVTAFATYLVMLEFGTGTVMQRNILLAKRKEDDKLLKKTISTMWYTTLGLSLLIFAAASIFYFNLGKVYANTMTSAQVAYAQKMFIFVVAYIVATFITQTLNGLLTGMENYTFTQSLNVFKAIVRTGAIIVAVCMARYAIVIVIVDFVVNTTCVLITFIFCKKRYKVRFRIKEFDVVVIKDALPLCLALMLQSLIQLANNSVDRTVIGIMMSMQAVAIYSVAQYIYHIFMSVCIAPITMFLPQIEKNWAKELAPKEFTKTLVQPCRLVALLAGSILFGFFTIGKQFLVLVYGQGREVAWIYALILIIPTFIYMTNFVIVNVLDLTKKRLVSSLIIAGTTVLNIVLTVLFIPTKGIVGAVGATAIAQIIEIILVNIYYSKSLKIRVWQLFLDSYKGILPFQIIAGVASFFLAKLIKHTLLSFLVGGSVYLLSSLLLIFFFGLNKGEKSYVQGIINKMRKNNR